MVNSKFPRAIEPKVNFFEWKQGVTKPFEEGITLVILQSLHFLENHRKISNIKAKIEIYRLSQGRFHSQDKYSQNKYSHCQVHSQGQSQFPKSDSYSQEKTHSQGRNADTRLGLLNDPTMTNVHLQRRRKRNHQMMNNFLPIKTPIQMAELPLLLLMP